MIRFLVKEPECKPPPCPLGVLHSQRSHACPFPVMRKSRYRQPLECLNLGTIAQVRFVLVEAVPRADPQVLGVITQGALAPLCQHILISSQFAPDLVVLRVCALPSNTLRRLPPATVAPSLVAMPPKRESAFEKSIRHSIKSAEAALKADKSLITAVMNQSQSCVPRLKKTLRDLGYIDEKDGIIERHEMPAPKVAPSAATPSPNKMNLRKDEPLPESVNTLADCDAQTLGYLLEMCEEITFNPHSLKALLKRGQRKIPKEPLLECVEFLTDMPRDVQIKTCGTLGNSVDLLSSKNDQNGRRGRDLRLPPNWSFSGVGFFDMVFEGNKPFLKERFSGRQAEIKHADLVQDRSTNKADWMVTNNFSMCKVALQRVGGGDVSCALLGDPSRGGDAQEAPPLGAH